MATNNNPPDFVSDFLGDEDPQSARAAEGLHQGVSLIANSKPVQNIVTGKGLNDYQSTLNAAMAGDENAQHQMAQQALGTAMGTTKASGEFTAQEPLVTGKVSNNIKQSNVALQPNGVQTPMVNGKPNYGKVGWEQGPLVKPNYGKVIRKAAGGSIDPSDIDPQSGVASQGMSAVLQALYNSRPVQNVVTGQGLQDYNTSLKGAVAGNPAAQQDIAQRSLGTAMGSVKVMSREDALAQGVKIPDVHTPAEELGRDVQNNYRLNNLPEVNYAVKGNKVVGHLGLDDDGAVKAVYVDNGARRQGIAESLYQNKIQQGEPFQSDELVAMEPQAKKLWEKLKSQYPDQITKSKEGYIFSPTIKKAYGGLMMAPTHAYANGGQVADAPDFVNQFNSAPQPSVNLPNQEETPGQQLPESQNVPAFVQDFIAPEALQAKYGTPGQQAIAGLEGAASGAIGPLAPLAEKALGVSPEGIRGRAEANPITHGAAELGTLAGGMATGLGEGALIGKAGQLTGKLVGEGGNLAKIVGRGAATGFVENALLQSGDEVSKMILNDPNASAQTAIANVGLSGLLGAGIGGAMGAVSPLWKAAAGNKLGQTIADFKGRMEEHMSDPDPVASATKQLGDYYNSVQDAADDVYGAKGIKAQDIAAVMPEMSDKIASQSEQIGDKLQGALSKLKDDPHAGLLGEEASKYMQALNSNDPGTIFNATQALKQQVQEWGRYNKAMSPLGERTFRNTAKDLAFDLKNSLEDTSVWGKAAERQQEINKAFTNYLPALKDFEKKFTVEVGGEKVIDPGKMQTYFNQIGKPNAEIKQSMLKNFLDASEKYKNVITDSHTNLGIPSPIADMPLNSVMATLKERTTGAKLADIAIHKGLTQAGGAGMGAAAGAGLAGKVGISKDFGAMIGAHALGPFFTTIMPALTKPLLKMASNSAGAKAAIDFSANVSQGDKILNNAVKSIFKAGQVESPKFVISEKDAAKLDKKIAQLQANPEQMTQIGGQVGHYLPEHNSSLAQTAVNAVNYLNTLRPNSGKAAPLDSPRVPSPVERAQYQRALAIAERPVSILDSVKNGTLTTTDVLALRTLYPQLYNQMSDKLVSQITDMGTKGQNVPYRVRMGLSLFLGQPMDSTMIPQNIISAQPQNATAPTNQPQAPVKTKTAALSKFGSQYQTKNQSAEQASISRK